MTIIALSRVHYPVTTLGPGRRVGIWVQGCSIRCPGCISPDTWATGRGLTTVDAVLDMIRLQAPEADGMTISGGEPFEQPEALVALIEGWRARSSGDVFAFTGLPFGTVRPFLDGHPGLIDALVAGPFKHDVPQTLALRGSDNQKLHILTARGEHFAAYDRPAVAEDRLLDVMFDADGGVWFAGISARGDFGRMRQVLMEQGHRVIVADGATAG